MRRHAVLAALILAVALTAVGTGLWISGILRPVPGIAPGIVRTVARHGRALDLTVDVGTTLPIDRAGETVREVARAIAGGRMSATLVTIDFRRGDTPLMRLAYDAGILASGAVSGGTGDHMLGLAGLGSRWPAPGDPAVSAYCGRMETMTEAFCKAARGG